MLLRVGLLMLAGSQISCAALEVMIPERTVPVAGAPCDGVDIGPWPMPGASTEPGGFDPDRRPVAHVPTWIGGGRDPLRRAPWWVRPEDRRDADGFEYNQRGNFGGANGRPDGVDNLLRRLETLYDRGFRRFSLKLPAGDAEVDAVERRKMASSQWEVLEPWMREAFRGPVRAWAREKAARGDPVSLGLYMGYHPADPRRLTMEGADFFDNAFLALDPSDPADAARLTDMMCRFRDNFEPWIQSGVTEFWFDNSSPADYWPALLRLQANPDYEGRARFHGEAIPTTRNGCDYRLVEDAIRRGAWIATFEVAEHRHWDTRVDPGLTELHLWMSGHFGTRCGSGEPARGWDMADLLRFAQNGWIVGPEIVYAGADVGAKGFAAASHEYLSRDRRGELVRNDGGGGAFLQGVEAAQRVHDMGFITCVADFNGDGRIEVEAGGGARGADLKLFSERWQRTRDARTGAHGFMDGDVNNDGRVDNADRTFFIEAARDYLSFRSNPANRSSLYEPPRQFGVDLGAPDVR